MGSELLEPASGSLCSGTTDVTVLCNPSVVQLFETCVQIFVTSERLPELHPNSKKISKMDNKGFISVIV